jgi:hypothetical protein
MAKRAKLPGRDKSWIIWDEFRTGSWPLLDQKIPQRIRETIGAKKSLIERFFNPAGFAIMDMMP